MMTDRANAICLLEVLREYSDENNIMKMSDIVSKMHALYSIKPDRRTVYSAISLLNELGYDISTFEENKTGYYLRQRDFDPSEILLLTNAVAAFPFIPATQSEKLIAKLQKQLCRSKRKQYKHLSCIRENKKTPNKQVFLNIELLDDAISEKRQISFVYTSYGLDKKLHPRRDEPYIANAYGMVYMNEHYYLICSLTSFCKISLYRIDRMKDIRLLDSPSAAISDYKKNIADAVYAFAGEPEGIVMHCQNVILNDVLDKFGTDIHISKLDENRFSASFDAPPDGIKFWAMQYLSYAEIIEPLSLRDEIIKLIKDNPYKGV